MALSKNAKLGILVVIPLITFLLPAPEGLSLIAWRLLGIYIATIVSFGIKTLRRTGDFAGGSCGFRCDYR